MPLLPEFPISGDDYTVGTITTTAGKKEFNTKDAYLNSFGAVRPGDHVYISTTGKILVIGSITGENSGTLADPCPDDCAVKDLPLRVIYKTASSRVQGRIAMLLERLSKGYLAAFSEITAKENQIFQATNVDGELKAIDLNADNIAETDKRKFITGDERNKIAKLGDEYLSKSGGTISGSLTVGEYLNVGKEIWSGGWITCNHTGDPNSWGAGFQVRSTQNPEYHAQIAYAGGGGLRVYVNGYGDVATFQRDGGLAVGEFVRVGKDAILQKNGNIKGSGWSYGDLNKHIENRCASYADDRKNACVTDSRVIGWAELPVTSTAWTHLPSGYFVTSQFGSNVIVGRQPQLYIANRGWFALGGW